MSIGKDFQPVIQIARIARGGHEAALQSRQSVRDMATEEIEHALEWLRVAFTSIEGIAASGLHAIPDREVPARRLAEIAQRLAADGNQDDARFLQDLGQMLGNVSTLLEDIASHRHASDTRFSAMEGP